MFFHVISRDLIELDILQCARIAELNDLSDMKTTKQRYENKTRG